MFFADELNSKMQNSKNDWIVFFQVDIRSYRFLSSPAMWASTRLKPDLFLFLATQLSLWEVSTSILLP